MGGHLVVIWRSSPSDFPYKQPQIVRSLVVPMELGGLHSLSRSLVVPVELGGLHSLSRSVVVPVELGGLHSLSIHPEARAAHTVHFLALLNRSKYSSFCYNFVIF